MGARGSAAKTRVDGPIASVVCPEQWSTSTPTSGVAWSSSWRRGFPTWIRAWTPCTDADGSPSGVKRFQSVSRYGTRSGSVVGRNGFELRSPSVGRWTASSQSTATDLGQSGPTAIAWVSRSWWPPVGMGEVGIVLGLEICALTDTLILDEDGMYNPGHFNDRLLLRLKGRRARLSCTSCGRASSEEYTRRPRRGELEMKLSVGLVYDSTNKVVLDPNLQV